MKRPTRVLIVLCLVAAASPVVAVPSAAGALTPSRVEGFGGHAQAGRVSATISAGRAATAASANLSVGSYPVHGIDVSAYQGNINWSSVAAGGVKFAYVKAVEGTFYYSSTFSAQYGGAKRAGLLAGAYAFGRPDALNPVAQADFLITNSQYANDGRTLPLMLDLEWPYSGSGVSASCWGRTAAQMVGWIRSFVDEVRAKTGKPTLIYTNPNWWNPCTGNTSSFSDQWLNISYWAAGAPSFLASGWSSWTVWQYADSGAQPGDQDVFNGSLAALQRLAAPVGEVGTARASVSSGGTGLVDAFYRGFDGTLWQTGTTATGWSIPASVVPGQISGDPVAVTQADGVADVFWRGPDSILSHAWRVNGNWYGPQSFGVGISTAPTVVLGPGGTMDVIYRDLGGRLWDKAYSAGWQVPRPLNVGVTGSIPSLVRQPDGSIEAYWSGVDGGLWTSVRTASVAGSWTAARALPGRSQGDPSAVRTSVGVADVFYRGPDGGLWHSWRVRGRWYGPESLRAGVLGSDPVAVGQPSGLVDVFWRGMDSGLWHKFYVRGWYGPQSLGGSTSTNPAAAVQATGVIDVVDNGPGRSLGHEWYVGGAWHGPGSLGGFLG